MCFSEIARFGVALALSLMFAAPVWATNTVDILHEGYDRYPTVGATISLVRGGDVVMVVDPGMVRDQTLITDALAELGLSPDAVTHVFLTHQHPDHTMNVGLFPDARVIDAYSMYEGDHWGEHRGDGYEIAEGMTLWSTPGHTAEDITLIVDTGKGVYAITHLWWHSGLTPVIDPFAEDQSALEESRARVLEQVDWIIPGHGGLVANPHKE
jgi:glyoxylase-like metal-dependent hydrolase (beta-lactamase superfamily II)